MPVRALTEASSRHALLGNQLRLKQPDPIFNQCAMYIWFEHLNRAARAKKEARGDYIFIHFQPLTNSWIWQIPISET